MYNWISKLVYYFTLWWECYSKEAAAAEDTAKQHYSKMCLHFCISLTSSYILHEVLQHLFPNPVEGLWNLQDPYHPHSMQLCSAYAHGLHNQGPATYFLWWNKIARKHQIICRQMCQLVDRLQWQWSHFIFNHLWWTCRSEFVAQQGNKVLMNEIQPRERSVEMELRACMGACMQQEG